MASLNALTRKTSWVKFHVTVPTYGSVARTRATQGEKIASAVFDMHKLPQAVGDLRCIECRLYKFKVPNDKTQMYMGSRYTTNKYRCGWHGKECGTTDKSDNKYCYAARRYSQPSSWGVSQAAPRRFLQASKNRGDLGTYQRILKPAIFDNFPHLIGETKTGIVFWSFGSVTL